MIVSKLIICKCLSKNLNLQKDLKNTLIFIPTLNPDGNVLNTRTNSNKVDIIDDYINTFIYPKIYYYEKENYNITIEICFRFQIIK